uniref:AlNc14C130G6916 protein n=1 Tax=Albugo laibachii Nc14 TaxID=890382 RepID=F0WK65_9STRA|nr:AlNc14C130G6916 [Albugo laibachii Nc14]|eukprot:CCA21667.1 AlNc14C130G6916 [Albugo laibachii Nc14]
MGEFRVAIKQDLKTIFVMHTERAKSDVAKACQVTGLCEGLEENTISYDECEAILSKAAYKFDAALEMVSNLMREVSGGRGQQPKLQCVDATLDLKKFIEVEEEEEEKEEDREGEKSYLPTLKKYMHLLSSAKEYLHV